jgi:hypothetical protein
MQGGGWGDKQEAKCGRGGDGDGYGNGDGGGLLAIPRY